MLTGDAPEVALKVCGAVGIDPAECRARLLPRDKLDWVRLTEGGGRRVCMVGDGINDAVALAGLFITPLAAFLTDVRSHPGDRHGSGGLGYGRRGC